MEKKVIVLTPNGRRQNIKVTPNTTLLQILEETCQRHAFDSDEYCLKHHNKEVDLTQMFRFSGLPNNALLEMARTEKKRVAANVDICVQLENGTRVQGQFDPRVNLWTVVEQLSAEAASEFASPVVIYMRQEVVGHELMLSTTLKSLGIIEGRAMIRFINKNPEELKTQANVYIPPVVKESPNEAEAPRNTRAVATSAGGFSVTRDLVQSLKKITSVATTVKESAAESEEKAADEAKANQVQEQKAQYDWGNGAGRSIRSSEFDIAAQTAAEESEKERQAMDIDLEPEVNIIGERNAVLYSLDSSPKHLEDLPDSFYDLTVNDLKLVLRDLKKTASGNEETPLLTEKLRQLEEQKSILNKMAIYKNCVIRIQFPNRLVLQGIFKPIDKIADVVIFIRKFLQNNIGNFELFTIPPKTVLPEEQTLLELNLVPTAVIHFVADEDCSKTHDGPDEEEHFIRPEFRNKLTTAEGALYAAHKFRVPNQKSTMAGNEQLMSSTGIVAGNTTGAIPKRPRNEDEFTQAS